MIGLVTQQARDEVLKAQQRRDAAREGTPAHEAAAAAQEEHDSHRGSMEPDCADDDGQEPEDAGKAAAAGHPFGDHPLFPGLDHLGCQPPVMPVPGPVVATVSGAGPLASSIQANPGVAAVAQMAAAAAASPALAAQLGHGAPSGQPVRPPAHVAPSGPSPAPRGPGVAALTPGSGR